MKKKLRVLLLILTLFMISGISVFATGVRRQIKASTNCIPKSNYIYKPNNCLAINCILKVHIIPIKEWRVVK